MRRRDFITLLGSGAAEMDRDWAYYFKDPRLRY